MLGVLKVLGVSGHTVPVVTPTLDGDRIVLTPLGFKIVKCLFGSILIEALESANTNDEDIMVLSVRKIRKHTKSRVGFLALEYVHVQKLFPSLAGKDIIDGTCHWPVLLFRYFIMNYI